jgi:putative nucleotidyltransferase with HDIG domain
VEPRRPTAARSTLWQRFCAAGGLTAAPIALAFYICAAAMDLSPVDPFPYRLNQYVPADVYARVSFEVESAARLEEARRDARGTTPALFNLDRDFVEEITSRLRQLPERLRAVATATAPAGTQPATSTAPAAPRIAPEDRDDFKIEEGANLRAWARVSEPEEYERYRKQVDELGRRLAGIYTVEPNEAGEQLYARKAKEFLANDGKGMQRRDRELLISRALGDAIDNQVAKLELPKVFEDPRYRPWVPGNVESYLSKVLRSRPLYVYDRSGTNAAIDAKIKVIESDPPRETVRQGDVIARSSRRIGSGTAAAPVGLRPDDLEKLRQEHREYYLQELAGKPQRLAAQVLGRGFILLLVTGLLGAYVVRYQPRIVREPLRAFTLAAVLVLMLGIAKIMSSVLEWNPHTVTLPVLMAAMVLAIAYDQRFAIGVGAVVSFLVVWQLRSDVSLLPILLTGVIAGVFPLRDIRTRGKLILVSGIAAGAVFAAVWGCHWAKDVPAVFALRDSLWAAGFSLLVGFLVWGILPVIERIFGVATSMTLLEWSDASKPLLKRLAMEAPGTYNHCLQLAAMCEAAAETIGARGLLARVGAYYHDIGKINKPEYFTENQAGSASKHERLSPAMSLLIILGHVRDGLELAREYALPRVLYEFIASHHGTTLVQYFYHQAGEQRRSASDRPPEEAEFRYHGPRPHSKEAAILMLADASESSVRSMADPTPGRIENQVHTMVTRRLMDGQLDECDLTLKEVHQIEASLIRTLCSTYHSRVAYPTPSGQKPSAAELRPKREAPRPAPSQERNPEA